MDFSFITKFFGKQKEVPQQPKAEYAWNGYEAATFSRDRSWIFSPSEDQIINPSEFTRNEIRRMSRYLIANYPLAKRIGSVCAIYGIGNGLSANATTQDSEFNKAATEAFSNWANNVFCTVDNEINLYEAQKVIATELLVCGEIFLVFIKSPQNDYPQLMLVRSEDVRGSDDPQDSSVDGVYFNQFGKALAYNIWTGEGYQKIDASNVIHLKKVDYAGQKRGISGFASSLNAMRDHKDMTTLIKRSLKQHLSLAVAVTKKEGDAGTNGIAGGLIGLNPGTNQIIPNFATGGQKTNIALERVYGGQTVYMQPGEEVELLSSDFPNETITDFMDRIMRDVCLSISLPFEFAVNPEKLTGTAVRFALSDASFFFNSLQELIINSALNRIYSWVIASFIKSGKLPSPKDGVLPYSVAWTKPISITVDQGRSDAASIALMQAGLLTRESYYSARGKDWKEEMAQSVAEIKALTELAQAEGVPIALLLPPTSSGKAAPEPENEDEEDNQTRKQEDESEREEVDKAA